MAATGVSSGDRAAWNIFQAMDLLCKNNSLCSEKLRVYLAKSIWTKLDRSTILSSLSEQFLNTNCVVDICIFFKPLVLEIAERTKDTILKQGHSKARLLFKFAVNLGLGLPYCAELKRFATSFIKCHKPFATAEDKEPEKKKAKRDKISDVDWCCAIYNYVSHLKDVGLDIGIDSVICHLTHQNLLARWYAALAISKIMMMSQQQKQTFLSRHFTSEEIRDLILRCDQANQQKHSLTIQGQEAVVVEAPLSDLTHTRHELLHSDLSPGVASVRGVLLPQLTGECNVDTEALLHWVGVDSMLDSLRTLALAVSASRPVLLEGVVGCGKTSLVQHLAALTGRDRAPHLLKIQLGDQTDSKALLGTYQCTEVPGQFVWKAGVLTEAVLKGHWLLLEDIDLAPMEVVSTLAPLVQTSTLSLPGHGDVIHAVPGFQLFATQRLMSGSSGAYTQNRNPAILDSLFTRITIKPLSRAELQEVIMARFPVLSSVVQRLLDIYFLLSAGRHDVTSDPSRSNGESPEEENTAEKFLSHTGRLISTRDLLLWCGRIGTNFDETSPATGPEILQAALDCFVVCLPSASKRLLLAEAIATKLNITKDRAEYFLNKHKPIVDISSKALSVGRAVLKCKEHEQVHLSRSAPSTFSFTRPAAALLERVAVCIQRNEPVLLVGETGTGKTSSVQFLAHQLGHKLHVINLNQQSDSTDLLGGFKPVDLKFIIRPFKEEFEEAFCETFSRNQNAVFLGHVQTCFSQKRWRDLLSVIDHVCSTAVKKKSSESGRGQKWQKLKERLQQLQVQVQETENVLAFSFIEGTLVKALRNGDWVLLDEINLAAAETLECLAGLLESTEGSVVLIERGDMEPIIRHKDFRLFACMNPATDVGKKDLTPGIRNRFTEFYVDELDEPADLRTLVSDYLQGLSLTPDQVNGIVRFYLEIKKQAATLLVDGTGHKPCYSLRSLCRALCFARSHNCGSIARSLYEGFCLSFLTQLDRASHPVVQQLVCKHILAKTNVKSILKQPLPEPSGGHHLNFEGYWISCGILKPSVPENYILTSSVRANLKDLSRAVSAGTHPVLLQGETSVGKTSLITWLAQSTGNVCMRVNNHEHTDLQEYVGCYAADESGKLVFREGVLVEAMRKGYWIILDELNLAPTDVLEALNRLLDDNRELFIPETQEVVCAHPKFMLFATQNPPGHYGGRKVLSRAFRNRFVELHFDEIPRSELETILHQRCSIPLSYARRLVAVMADLQMRRQGSGVFAGKQGFMTLRDLFRWAERYNCPEAGASCKFYNWDQHLADHGFMLLAGRVRKEEEVAVIQEVIERHMKCKVGPERLFDLSPDTSSSVLSILQQVTGQSLSFSQSAASGVEGFEHVVWTRSMRRLAVLMGQAVRFREPVLLVGDTGCGKTTMCQLFSAMNKKHLYCVNCHLHSESADFLGGLRPVRSHDEYEDSTHQKLFEWVDGPLVTAMKTGSMFLIDEISLAEDSVLERLNSVLESERSLLLAEKGGGEGQGNKVEMVQASEGFQVFATMNPGGDFGKKELSPALRNRFTEIWCPQSVDRGDLIAIIDHNISPGLYLSASPCESKSFGSAIMDFVAWFSNKEFGKRCTISIRDILTWVNFINNCSRGQGQNQEGEGVKVCLEPAAAYIHGACLVFLDALGSGVTSQASERDTDLARTACLSYLQQQVERIMGHALSLEEVGLCPGKEGNAVRIRMTANALTVFPFTIPRECAQAEAESKYALQAPTTCINAQRLLRGLQLPRPLLLEGAPGVGKTSLVAAVARLAGRELVRINLSDQTDVTDLFGADLPVEGGAGGTFAWRDGPFLQALKAGHWVVFDELNLASQSVLEGLNACLDHRGEVYIPELGRTFQIQHGRTRIFACQNPHNQGGGRKGLPRSFLNRFTQVYVEPLTKEDLIFICTSLYPSIPHHILVKMVDFNMKMHEETMVLCSWGRKGAPWEFNLRDINRWCELMLANQSRFNFDPGMYAGLIYQDRMRTVVDKNKVAEIFSLVFGLETWLHQPSRYLSITASCLQVGSAFLLREHGCMSTGGGGNGHEDQLMLLHHSLGPLESLMTCVSMGWMTILVGPSSGGKSSMVQLLAELTGHQLLVLPVNSAMDTTELLGGFEQADIGRHVLELSKAVEAEVRAYERHCMVDLDSGNTGLALSLDNELQKLKRSNVTDVSSDPGHEVERLKSQARQLQRVLDILQTLQVTSEHSREIAAAVESQLKSLKSIRSGAGGAGAGTFEWVDSVLVKALKSGAWLLIDNVNFCSPSVLDRLNAVLEPGGVLTVNERGATDGSIPTIKPHPQFRLFLTMDPKHGEISRAMRNRGVEIYIPGEEDGCPYSHYDTISMLHGAGLNSQMACDWLLQLHALLRERLPSSEKPSMCDLLHSAVMVKQQLEKGIGIYKALRAAACNIYGSRMTSSATQERPTVLPAELVEGFTTIDRNIHPSSKSVIKKQADQAVWTVLLEQVELLREKEAGKEVNKEIVEQPVMAATVHQYQENCFLTTVQQAARVLCALVSHPELFGFDLSHENASSDHHLHAMLSAAQIFTGQLSQQTWKLAVDWLKMHPVPCQNDRSKMMTEILPEKASYQKRVQRAVFSAIERSLRAVFEGQASMGYQDALKALCYGSSEVFELLADQPWDLTTNPQALQRAMTQLAHHYLDARKNQQQVVAVDLSQQVVAVDLSQQVVAVDLSQQESEVQQQLTNRLEIFNTAVHRLQLVQMATVSTEILKDGIEQLSDITRKASRYKLKSTSLVSRLHSLLTHLMTHLPDIVGGASDVSISCLHQTQDAFLWLSRLLHILVNPVQGQAEEVFTSLVALHWQWCWDKLLCHLVSTDSSQNLMAMVSQLQSMLGAKDSEAKLFVKFWSSWGHPPAFSSEAEARMWHELCRLCKVFSVSGPMPLEVLKHKIKALASKGEMVRQKIRTIAGRLTSGDLNVALDLQQLSEAEGFLETESMEISACRPCTSSTSSALPAVGSSSKYMSCHIQLWPVFEHLALLAELSYLLSCSKHGTQNAEEQQRVMNYICCAASRTSCFAIFSEQSLSPGHQKMWLQEVLHRLWYSPAVSRCQLWLRWGTGAEDCATPGCEMEGPGVLHRSPLLLYMSHLLSTSHPGSQNDLAASDLLPVNVTLGRVEDQVAQLNTLARHLWKHLDVLGSSKLSIGSLEESLLIQSFLSLMSSLTFALDTSGQEKWSEVIAKLRYIPRSNDQDIYCTNLAAWRDNRQNVKDLLLQAHSCLGTHAIGLRGVHGDPDLATVNLVGDCFGVMMETLSCEEKDSVVVVGKTLVHISCVLLHLLAPRGQMDPIEKAAIKLRHFRKEMVEIDTEMRVWDLHLKLSTGLGLQDTHPTLYPSRLVFLLHRHSQLQAAVATLEERQAYRKDGMEFLRMSQEVANFLQSVGSLPAVSILVSRLVSAGAAVHLDSCAMVTGLEITLQEEQTWQAMAQHFCQQLESGFPCLRDMTVPVCLMVQQMQLGMRAVAQDVQHKAKQSQIGYCHGHGIVEDTVSALCRFPSVHPASPTLLELAAWLCSPGNSAVICRLVAGGDDKSDDRKKTTHSKLLMCSLLLIKAHALHTCKLTSDLLATLTHALELFVVAWRREEEQRRRKEEEEAALFHIKEKVHGDERTAAEQEEAAFQAAFPMYREDFEDMIEATRLEDTGRREQTVAKEKDRVAASSVSEHEMYEVCHCHTQLMQRLTTAAWISRSKTSIDVSSWDILRPMLMMYQMTTDIGKMSWDLLGDVDRCAVGSHLIVCSAVSQSVHLGEGPANPSQVSGLCLPKPKCYNFYIDPNIPEVIQCRPVLHGVVARVTELQQEWPDHPTLKQLCDIVGRVTSFPVTAPVSKFLTGLELLVQKAQYWESNASSKVSMATQLSEVTAVIVHWRKLELSCWSGALDVEVDKSRRKASRWWFHVYSLMMAYLEKTDQDKLQMEELVKSLKQYLESSTMGEYSVRLDILMAFHCQLINTESSEQRDRLMHLLWNIHLFYSQFCSVVESEIARLRVPIEKELKGFVKIARWSDMNYWALKDSTERTHRVVHKHTRAFQAALNQPVKGLLGEKPSNLPQTSGTEESSSNYSESVSQYGKMALKLSKSPADAKDDVVEAILGQLPACGLQLKLTQLGERALKHWRSLLKTSAIFQDVGSLDDLTGQIIEQIQELQKLTVVQNSDKERQKVEARYINLQKRRALADLFKQLAYLGLKYRKGLYNEKNTFVDGALLLPPLDPSACLDKSDPLIDLWDGCNTYFTRCVSRMAQFSGALQSPSKELGPANLERCHGFAEHLAGIYLSQRQELTAIFNHFVDLRKLLKVVDSLQDSSNCLPPHTSARKWLEEARRQTTSLAQGLIQIALLLQSCPVSDGFGQHSFPSPFLTSHLSPAAHLQHGDELWTFCNDRVKTFLAAAKGEQQKLLVLSENVMVTSMDLESISSSIDELAAIGHGLREMKDMLSPQCENAIAEDQNCLTSTVAFFSSSLLQMHSSFLIWKKAVAESLTLKGIARNITQRNSEAINGSETSENMILSSGWDDVSSDSAAADVTAFASRTEHLVEAILLSIQKLAKSEEERLKRDARERPEGKTEVRVSEDSSQRESEDDDESIKENHLTVLVSRLQQYTACLQCPQMITLIQELQNSLLKTTEQVGVVGVMENSPPILVTSICMRVLTRCSTLLHIYRSMLEKLVAEALALHRTMGKILSVLLSVFTELAMKGFCLPAEYSDEVGEEGATDFVDIEGGGLGEGQGAKDVSDQIESEDQLDEAKKPGEEKDEQPEEQRDIAPEDNGIEMSDDFDAKPQDLEPVEGGGDDDDNDDKEEEEMEKQMGEVDGPGEDRLDEQMWGSDEEDEDESKEEKEEDGAGSRIQGESELVAEDDVKKSGEDEDERKAEEKKAVEEEKEKRPHELDQFEEPKYDDDGVDPHHGDQNQQQDPENLDLPEDLNLDEDEEAEAAGDQGEGLPNQPEDASEVEDMEDRVPDENNDDEKEEKKGEEQEENREEECEKKEKREDDVSMEEPKEQKDTGHEQEEEQQCNEEEGDEKAADLSDQQQQQEEEARKGEKGFGPQDQEQELTDPQSPNDQKEEIPEKAEDHGMTSHDTACPTQSELAQNQVTGQEDAEEKEGVGTATTDQDKGHQGSQSTTATESGTSQENRQIQKKPGHSRSDRSLGHAEEKFRRLKTTDRSSRHEEEENDEVQQADVYEHITDDVVHADAQTLDAATDQQQQQQKIHNRLEEKDDETPDEATDVQMEEKEEDAVEAQEKSAKQRSTKQASEVKHAGDEREEESMEVEQMEVPGSKVLTLGAERPPESSIHTQLEHLLRDTMGGGVDVEMLRNQLEDTMKLWLHPDASDPHMEEAAKAWQKYETLTSSLSQDLCEQLRLVLEPSQATRLKGDYRTGKRLNMRKVIPYIASQFRKDKIWLRRTKPSKRQYQIMLALDDSSSMADNRSKQLAFESLALIANALTLLETGELAVCSFGETVKLLHPFTETFSNQAGACVLQQFTFEQKKTRFTQLLQQVTVTMLESRSRQRGMMGRPETAQLLLVVSDGRGVFAEGTESVKKAVRQACEANVFLVFIVLDEPQNKNSILDIRISEFQADGKPPVFRPYMEQFPFPFYVILRDINSLPQILSDALRQWFELVSASAS